MIYHPRHIGTRPVLGNIDPARPLRSSHPLLKGVQGFWLPLPHLSGGGKLYDISGRGRHGTRQGPSWIYDASIPYPGLNFFEDNTERVNLEQYIIPSSADFSLSFRIRVAAAEDADDVLYGQGNESDGTNRFLMYSVTDFGTATKSVRAWSSKLGELVVGSDNRGLGWVDTTLTREGDTWTLYEDGEQVSSNAVSGSLGIPASAFIGAGLDGNGALHRYFNGDLAFLGVHHRALSAAEVGALHDQTRRGFPDLLRTRRSVSLLDVSSGGDTTITGSFAITDSGEVIDASGNTIVSGSGALTDSGETLSFTGKTIVSGTASVTDSGETIDLTGAVLIAGPMDLTDGQETISGSGSVIVGGSAAITEGGETLEFIESTTISGTLAVTEGGETVLLVGKVARLTRFDIGLYDMVDVEVNLSNITTLDITLED